MLHVTQLDRIVDVVEETSKGRVVTLLAAWHVRARFWVRAEGLIGLGSLFALGPNVQPREDKKREGLPSLALPKVRQDRLTEIITINAGCLNFCTYCGPDMGLRRVQRCRQGLHQFVCEMAPKHCVYTEMKL